MIPEAMVAMLACNRIGAVHSVVFGGFAAKEISVRIDDCTPKVIITASCGIEKINTPSFFLPAVTEAVRLAKHKPSSVVLQQRTENSTFCASEVQITALRAEVREVLDFQECLLFGKKKGGQVAVPLLCSDPLYVII
tara:strand:+ start:90 stop:500 length:411 start_codon:yes stop_codon:yes gene_type:complete